MSDLFGGSAQPGWMDTTTRESLLQRMGNEDAASFNQAFERAWSSKDQETKQISREGRAEDQRKKLQQEQAQKVEGFLGDFNKWAGKDALVSDGSGEAPEGWSAKRELKPGDSLNFLKENPKWALDPQIGPLVQKWAMDDAQQLKIQQQADDAKLRADSGALSRDKQKYVQSWAGALGAVSDANVISAIQALDDEGWNRDKQGRQLGPSQQALQIYNEWATNGGKNPEKAFGFKSNPVASAKARGEEARATDAAKPSTIGRLLRERDAAEKAGNTSAMQDLDAQIDKLNLSPAQLEDQKQKNRLALKAEAQKNAKELIDLRQRYRIDTRQFESDLRVEAKKTPLTREQFINKHYEGVYKAIAASPNTTALEASDATKTILSHTYDKVMEEMPPDTKKSTSSGLKYTITPK